MEGKKNITFHPQKYFKYWLKTAELSFESLLSTRLASAFYLVGKFVRFSFFIYFLITLGSGIQNISGYSLQQLILFFLIFNLFDLFGQIFYRGIYWFRQEVVSGNFDFTLTKPINPLFQILTVRTDFLDLPLLLVVVVYLAKLSAEMSLNFWGNLIPFLLAGLSSMIIITALHVIVAAIGVITTEVDHTIMIYRDLSSMARFPVDIYLNFIRLLITFVVPIAIIFTFPAKVLLSLLSLQWVVSGVFLSIGVLFLSLKLWKAALKLYSSASS